MLEGGGDFLFVGCGGVYGVGGLFFVYLGFFVWGGVEGCLVFVVFWFAGFF